MSRPDPDTLAVYDRKAGEYGTRFSWTKPYPRLEAFLSTLPDKARILDLGCGIGTASAHMRDAGFDVVPLDPSTGMAAEAKARHDLDVLIGDFDAIPDLGRFHAVWAHFSLLHADRTDLPRHFAAIHRALHPGGPFLVAMKTGTTTARDRLGRRYTYVTEAELTGLLTEAGFTPAEIAHGADEGLDGTVAPWIMVTAHA